MATTTRGTDRGTGTTALVVLLWLAWLTVPLALIAWSVLTTWDLYGEPPTPEEQRQSLVTAWAAGVVAVATPLAGLVVCVRSARPGSAAAFTVALVAGLVAGSVGVGPHLPQGPPAVEGPAACQERSGGDTDCPGG